MVWQMVGLHHSLIEETGLTFWGLHYFYLSSESSHSVIINQVSNALQKNYIYALKLLNDNTNMFRGLLLTV